MGAGLSLGNPNPVPSLGRCKGEMVPQRGCCPPPFAQGPLLRAGPGGGSLDSPGPLLPILEMS